MPDSDVQGELGGLAQSIDALFSQRPAPPAEPAVPAADEAPAIEEPAADLVAEAAPALFDEVPEPDPFESLRAHEDLVEERDAAFELSFADVEVPQEVVWESPEAAEEGGDAPADAGWEQEVSDEVDAGVDAGIAEGVAEAEDAGLEAAIESFLSGTPSAADEVREISTQLGDRLALDPLADAVERLVHADGASGGPDAPGLAQEIINPAVASRLVQRMGREEDEERLAAYVVLSERLGMVMAKAFRGAMTDHTDERARRAYYDGMLSMGEVSRPVIEAMVEDDNRFLVRNALAMLGEMGGEGTVELVRVRWPTPMRGCAVRRWRRSRSLGARIPVSS